MPESDVNLPGRWRRIVQLYHAALPRDTNQRKAFLDDACAGDPALRRDVESLLANEGTAEEVLSPPALEVAPKVTGVASLTTLAGRQIGGHYRLSEKIGEGGMGIVYRAFDERLKRAVAIKLLPLGYEHDRERMRRFTNEARAASALNHPNILTVHEIGDADGVPFIAMELIDGDTLRQRLRAGAVPFGEALDIALQVALALAAAHEKGIVHRDIKPENVMVRSDGLAKVLDFGLATLRPQTTRGHLPWITGIIESTGAAVMGTPAYMSPEQIEGKAVDPRSDLFSFGVLLCELTTGTNPFARASLLETLNALAQTPHSAVSVVTPLGPALARIVTKALEKSPADRYQTIEELAADLRRTRAETGKAAPHSSLRSETMPRQRVSTGVPLWLTFLLIPLAIAGLGFLISTIFNRAIGLSERFGWESPSAWFQMGFRSIVAPLLILTVIRIAVTVAGVTGRMLSSRFSTMRRIDRGARRLIEAIVAKLGLNDPHVLAQAVAILGAVALVGAFWRFSDLIHAFLNPISDMLPEQLAKLQPNNTERQYYEQTLTLLVLALAFSSRYVFKARARARVTDHAGWARAGIVVLTGSLILLEMPYRVLFHNAFERADFNESPCYVIGENRIELLLHCPMMPPPRNRIVKRDDPLLKRLGVKRSIYQYPP
jgi:serine/threonine protein kinase